MANGGAENRRRRLYVHGETQKSYIVGYGLAALAAMAATGFSILFLLHVADMEQYRSMLPYLIGLNIAVLLGVLLMIMVLALVASHKVGGPLYHCQRVLGVVTKGDLRVKVRLREGDHLHGLAEVINDMVESLNIRVADVQSEAQVLRQKAEGDPSAEELAAQAARLCAKMHNMFNI